MRSARRALASNSFSRAGSVVSLMLLVRLCRSGDPNHCVILWTQVKHSNEILTARRDTSDHHIMHHSSRHAIEQAMLSAAKPSHANRSGWTHNVLVQNYLSQASG